jgi:hypothetical protein
MIVVAPSTRTGGGAQADRSLREHHHGVADADVGVLGALEAGGHDVGAHQHLLVAEPVGNGREVGLRVGHQQAWVPPIRLPKRQPAVALKPWQPQRVVRTDIGNGLVGQLDAAGLDEYGGFYHGGHGAPLAIADG